MNEQETCQQLKDLILRVEKLEKHLFDDYAHRDMWTVTKDDY